MTVTQAEWAEFTSQPENADIWGEVTDKTLAFAEALSIAVGADTQNPETPLVDRVSWYVEDADAAQPELPDAPWQITVLDSAHGNFARVLIVNDWIMAFEDGDGPGLSPIAQLPANLAPCPPVGGGV